MMQYRLPYILLLVAILAGTAQVQAQQVVASALLTADAQRITVGDQARVFLTVKHDPSNSRIIWPQVPDSFGKLEVVAKDRIDTVKEGSTVTYKQKLMVTGFDSGMFTIPPFDITVAPASGQPYNIQTGVVNLLVQTVPVDTTKPYKPIKGIMEVELTWRDYIWYIIGAAVLLIGIIALIIYFSRRKKPVPVVPPPPPEPLHVKALRMLQELERESIWQKGEVKEYYVRLTDILRNYIEARYGLPAMERTTDELTSVTRHHQELARHTQQLYTILATADMAKFARAQPLPEEHISTMQLAKDFVTATIPAPTPPTPAQ